MASLYKKPVFRKDPKTGERVKGKSKKWWAQYRDELGILRRKPLSVDKAAAQAMLQSIVKEVEHRKAGILDPIGEAMRVPIRTHLSDFRQHLDAEPPVVTVAAAYSKRRREDRILLHTQVVERLRPWLDRQPEDERLFPITAHGNITHGRKTSKMMRLDLEAARQKWLAEEGHEKPSDFLAYRGVSGKVTDFHSLRHTFITNLARSGV
jgi:hypothetical protein